MNKSSVQRQTQRRDNVMQIKKSDLKNVIREVIEEVAMVYPMPFHQDKSTIKEAPNVDKDVIILRRLMAEMAKNNGYDRKAFDRMKMAVNQFVLSL